MISFNFRERIRAHFALVLLAGTTLSAAAGMAAQTLPAGTRQVESLNAGWRFYDGDTPGAEQANFDDHAWMTLSVPHDWSIAGPVAESNPTGAAGGFFPNGIGWYRRSFTMPRERSGRRVFIAFDGVMANSDVWINGFHLGHRPNGYISFYYDITDHLRTGANAQNIIAVKCDNSQQPASRWYEGAGIYRSVRLVSVDAVHIAPWGTVVTTPDVSANAASVMVESEVVNDSDKEQDVALDVQLQKPDGTLLSTPAAPSVSKTIAPHGTATLRTVLNVPQPDRWDIDHPALYRLHAGLKMYRVRKSDGEDVTFGIRSFHFDAARGFYLNGRNLKIYGAALHVDGGAVGIAVPKAINEARLRALKALGVNAIRTAHNPPSPEFLDLCDRIGLLVMDEMFDVWTVGKEPYDYHLSFKQWAVRDVIDTVRRDRNHPSIILWSAGNEIHDTPHPELAKPILASLIAAFHANDPTRPVTQALFRPNVSHDYDDGLADMLDVIGQNYREKEILAAHNAVPTRKIIGTENTHDRDQWVAMRDHPAYSGQFLWTGIDYLGEAGRWPLIGIHFGLLDRTLRVEPHGLERESWWSQKPVVHIVRIVEPAPKSPTDPGYEPVPTHEPLLPREDWTPDTKAPHTEIVNVYTNAEEVDLVLNGRSLGRQALHADASPLVWKVPYAAGTLRAIAYRGGQIVAQQELQTAGPAARILLHAERGGVSDSFDDLLAVNASVVDANGVVVPGAPSTLRFTVSGPGVIVDTDSGSNVDHVPFPSPDRETMFGHATAYVRANAASGHMQVTASAEGLATASLPLDAIPATAPPARSF